MSKHGEPATAHDYSNRKGNNALGDRWSAALFSSRETDQVLINAIRATLQAGGAHKMVLDVIVNGNRRLAETIAKQHKAILDGEKSDVSLRIWHLRLGDKANAWNQYVYNIWPNSETTFFVDGYVEVLPDAFGLLDRGMAGSDHYLAATGVPQFGRSAARLREQMIREGGIHGNLFAMKRSTLDALRTHQFKLPLGIYRTDPTLGAALAFDLDPANNEFDNTHIRVEAGASWSYAPLSIFKLSHLLTHVKRAARQAQGDLENRAVRNHFAILKRDLKSLPETTQDLVENWLSHASSEEKWIFLRKPLCLYALHNLRKQPRHTPSEAELLNPNN